MQPITIMEVIMTRYPNIPLDLERLADCLQRGRHTEAVRSVKRFPFNHIAYADLHQVLADRAMRPLWQFLPGFPVRIESVDPDLPVMFGALRVEALFDREDRRPYALQYEGLKRVREVLCEWELITRSRRELARRNWEEFQKQREIDTRWEEMGKKLAQWR